MRRRRVLRKLPFALVLLLAGCGAAAPSHDGTAAPASIVKTPPFQAGVLGDPAATLPHRNDMGEPAGLKRVTIHRAVQGDYQFLSGPCIVAHGDRLFACWTNSARDEAPDEEVLRGRWSSDGGQTWGPIQLIAGNATPKSTYGHGTLLSAHGKLWVFAARFVTGQGGEKMVVNVEAFLYDEQGGKWQPRGLVAEKFWPLDAPQWLESRTERVESGATKPQTGSFIVGGDHGVYPGEGPAVAFIDADDPTKWQVVDIPFKYDAKKDDKPPYAIETTLWVGGGPPGWVAAIMRNPYKDVPLMSVSGDAGRTWSAVAESNFPMAESKPFAGTLSTGQRYLVCNSGNREFLILAVTRPGATALSKAWMVRKGHGPARWPTHSKTPQWSYPWAVEFQGNLYVTYAVAKEDCEVAIIPVKALKVE